MRLFNCYDARFFPLAKGYIAWTIARIHRHQGKICLHYLHGIQKSGRYLLLSRYLSGEGVFRERNQLANVFSARAFLSLGFVPSRFFFNHYLVLESFSNKPGQLRFVSIRVNRRSNLFVFHIKPGATRLLSALFTPPIPYSGSSPTRHT
jgi:hypothetical protein